MAGESSRKDQSAAGNNPQRQRAYYTRTRTGCITCRVRKIRCDEQKPFCIRCASTGRKCDGYAQEISPLRSARSSASARSQTQQNLITIPQRPTIPLPRNNYQELRSYHFFLDVTAPTIASVFDVDFWLTDIPRACHLDSAIWHAVVSLGAVHEQHYIASRGADDSHQQTPFAIEQFNAAIRHLVHHQSSRTVPEAKWRALTASVLFTYLCSMQRQYSQSVVHLGAAKNLIKEIEEGRAQQPRAEIPAPSASNTAVTSGNLNNSSVSYESLLSIVANLENSARAIQGGVIVPPTFLEEASLHTAWRYYTAPARIGSSSICQHGKCIPSRATPENIARAGRAFESLVNALMYLSLQNSAEVARLMLGGDNSVVKDLALRQEPYSRTFRELDAAISMFIIDTADECSCFEPANRPPQATPPGSPSAAKFTSTESQLKAIKVLRLYRAACYPFFMDKRTSSHSAESSFPSKIYHPLRPDTPPASPLSDPIQSPLDTRAALTRHLTHTLDMAESILQDDCPQTRTSASDFTPRLPTTLLLFLMSNFGGVTLAMRRRVIALLRQYPRRESMWDSKLAASVLELLIKQEYAGAQDANQTGGEMSGGRDGLSEEQKELDEEDTTPETANRVYTVSLTFTEGYSARVTLQTWAHWMANESGREERLTW